jgi:hypothetical protein
MINSKFLDGIVEPALADFFSKELSLLLDDVSERCLCTRLAMHLETHMKNSDLIGYYADTEYNRKQDGQVKTILNGDMKIISITCDLIVHSRGEIPGRDNLIAFEMAKPNKSADEMQNDRDRLIAMTKASYDGIWSNDGKTHPEHVCGYVKGHYLILNRQTRQARLESFAHGAISKAAITIDF